MKEAGIVSTLLPSTALIKPCMDVLPLMVQSNKKKQVKAIFWGDVQEREGWHCSWSAANCDTEAKQPWKCFMLKEICVCMRVWEINSFKHRFHDCESGRNTYIMLVWMHVFGEFMHFCRLLYKHAHEWTPTNTRQHTWHLLQVTHLRHVKCECVCPDLPPSIYLYVWMCGTVCLWLCLSACQCNCAATYCRLHQPRLNRLHTPALHHSATSQGHTVRSYRQSL